MSENLEIGDVRCTIAPPASYAAREMVLDAGPQNVILATAAALGMSWQGEGKPSATLSGCGYNVLDYGAAVFDELAARGLNPAHIRAAGLAAWNQIARLRLGEAEVAAATDFSDGGEE